MDDSGETVTVAVSLGLGHPPGYPLHSLLGRLATRAPWASAVWRMNALAALLAALTAVLLALNAATAQRRTLLAAAAVAVLFALGPIYWHNALGAKGSIYQLNNLFSVALLALLLGPLSPMRLRLFWLIFGLAGAHHYMSQLPLLPAYAWLLWRGGALGAALRQAWLLLPGLALYAYLPLRWRLDPELAWGSFGSWEEFWFFLFRLQYAAGELTRSWSTSGAQFVHAVGLMLKEGSGVLSLLAVLGAWAGRRERLAQALSLGVLAALAAVTLYLNLKPERLDLMRPYLFPAYLCQAWLAVLGLSALAQKASMVPALALAGGLILGSYRWPSQNLNAYYFASDNARSLLQCLPANALLLAQGDAVIFPLWHRQRVLKIRPDVAVIGLAVLPMEWVRVDLGRRHGDLRHPRVLGPIGAESIPRLTQAYLELNGHRPLYAAFNRFDPPVPGWRLQSEGLAWRVVRDSSQLREDLPSAAQRLATAIQRGFTRRPLDPRTLSLIVADRAIAWNSLGVAAEESNAPAQALAFYRQAGQVHPENPDFPFNQGNALHAMRRLDLAIEAFRRSVALDPRYGNGWYNLGVTLYQLGRMAEAKEAFRALLALDPSRNDVRQLLQQMGP